jgi:hypothetical protein
VLARFLTANPPAITPPAIRDDRTDRGFPKAARRASVPDPGLFTEKLPTCRRLRCIAASVQRSLNRPALAYAILKYPDPVAIARMFDATVLTRGSGAETPLNYHAAQSVKRLLRPDRLSDEVEVITRSGLPWACVRKQQRISHTRVMT